MANASISISTPLVEISGRRLANLSPPMTRKLATAVAPLVSKTDASDVTVEDLLNYFPTRYEDRSHFLRLDQLEHGMEAAVELYVSNSGGMQVGRNRDRRKPPLYLFEITGGDAERRMRPVAVKWFISGKGAAEIVKWYVDRFPRGTR